MEEHQDPENPNQVLDTDTQKKHALMLERLSNLHQTRLLQSLARKSDSVSGPSFESTQSFLTRFGDSKRSIESQLDGVRLTADLQRRSDLQQISTSIADLEKLVAENSYYLPSYEIRSALKSVSELKQTLDNLNSELLPKKKFSFRNKGAKKEPTNAPKEKEIGNADLQRKPVFAIPDSPGFRNKKGEVLVKDFKDSDIGEFTISDLDSCEVGLSGCVRTIFIHRLKNCRVFAGPVSGSILIEEVEGCVFVLASHQIRIHYAKGSDFYLRVRSRPIIEDSNGVRFAPYCLYYQGIEEDLKDSGLDEETGNWANVDDFRWLRAVQSPNWSALSENERIGTVNIPILEIGCEES